MGKQASDDTDTIKSESTGGSWCDGQTFIKVLKLVVPSQC